MPVYAPNSRSAGDKPLSRWGTIVVVTLAIRLFLLRLVARNMSHNVRYQAIQPEMKDFVEKIQEANKGGDKQATMYHTKMLQKLFSEHDVSPVGPFRLALACSNRWAG